MYKLLFLSFFFLNSLSAEIIILMGPSSSGKTTAAKIFSEIVEGKTATFGFDLLSKGVEGEKFQCFLLEHQTYKQILLDYKLDSSVNLFRKKDRSRLDPNSWESIESRVESFVEQEGVAYKFRRLVHLAKNALQYVDHILLDVLEAAPLQNLLKKEGEEAKVVFLYLPLTKYLERVRVRNCYAFNSLKEGDLSAERELRDPLDMITQYAKFFSVTSSRTSKSVEPVSSVKNIFFQDASDEITLFREIAQLYSCWGKEEEALGAEQEARQIELRMSDMIKKAENDLNPLTLKRGFLTFKPDIKADLYLNTFQLSPNEVGKQIKELLR